MGELNEQELDVDPECPECGAGSESVQEFHNLSNLGYAHDDVKCRCTECGERFTFGVPIGDPDERADLTCTQCDTRGLVHKANPEDELLVLMKCPECSFAWQIEREYSESGTALIGYAETTGSEEDAEFWY